MYGIEQLSVWHWLILGIIFLLLELLWGRGYCFWYAVLAGLVGVFQMTLPHYQGYEQVITFVALSLVVTQRWYAKLKKGSLIRHPHMENFNIASAYIGKTFVLQKNMKKLKGKVWLDNRRWRLRSKENLKKGADVKVIGHDGVILIIQQVS